MSSKRLSKAIGVLSLLIPGFVTGADRVENEAHVVEGSQEQKLEFFEKKIRPLLVQNCYTCHSANTNARGGLRVDDFNGLLTGGNSGAALVPGNPEQSLLLKAVRHEDDAPKMPPGGKLSDEQIADLTRWIEQGAAWPQPKIEEYLSEVPADYEDLVKEHWAWQPLAKVAPPEVQDSAWSRHELDRFILARLEQAGLQPVSDAGKRELIRRATFDLTGLPPTPEEVEAFLNDTSEQAFEKVVDRLLDSQAYAEHWARHWLDVARYGESTGSSRNLPYPHAWRYRDYVIDAFQSDKPFDQFLREQIAGDLLPAETEEQKSRQIVATGFLAVGVKDVNQRFKVRYIMDNVDEQIDTVTRAALGLTVSCARCHDHKFDPIPTSDYYALAGIFESTDLCDGLRNKMGGGGLDYYDTSKLISIKAEGETATVDQEAIESLKKRYENAVKEFNRLKNNPEGDEKAPNGRPKRQVARQRMNRLKNELDLATNPALHGPIALGVRDGTTIRDTPIRLRGEAEMHGPVVPRGVLSLVRNIPAPEIPKDSSGRLELAQWITHPDNALTSRVAVNRIWAHLFGRGIVSTVDNFGVTGDNPTHPELLDYLAIRFIENGWSVKSMIREVMLSRTYQLGSAESVAGLQIDPSNRLLWRHSPRRLTAEEIRDAMLFTAGTLNKERRKGSDAQTLEVREIRNNGPEARKLTSQADSSRHRSIYLPLLRGLVPHALHVFDFAEQGMVTGQRDCTTVAPQSLYLLNDLFVRQQSLALAQEILGVDGLTDEERIDLAVRKVLNRPVEQDELQLFKVALNSFESEAVLLAEEEPSVVPASAEALVAVNTVEDVQDATDANANPDEADQTDAPIIEGQITYPDARSHAWAIFCQSLYGCAEFRYLK